jgi:hypothetical protein
MIGQTVQYESFKGTVEGEVVSRFNDNYWYVKTVNGVVPVNIKEVKIVTKIKININGG